MNKASYYYAAELPYDDSEPIFDPGAPPVYMRAFAPKCPDCEDGLVLGGTDIHGHIYYVACPTCRGKSRCLDK